MRIIYSIIFILFLSNFHSQILDKNYYLIDSLDKSKINKGDLETIEKLIGEYHTLKSDTDRIQKISDLAENIYDEKIWPRYNTLMLNLAIQNENNSNKKIQNIFLSAKALALNNIGYYFDNFTQQIDSAEYYYKKAIEIAEKTGDIERLIIFTSNTANIYQNRGEHGKALDIYNNILLKETKLKNKALLLPAMNNIANIYLYLGDTSTCLIYLKRCFLIAKNQNDLNMKAHLLHNMGTLMARKNDSKGIQSVKTALYIRKKIGDKKGIAKSLLVLSSLMLSKKDVSAAKIYLQEAEPIIKEINNTNSYALYYRNLGDFEELKGNKKESIDYYIQSINKFKEAKAIDELVNTLEYAAKLCGDEPEFKALKNNFLAEHYIYNKQLDRSNVQRVAAQLKFENELKIKEAEQKIKDEKSHSEKRVQQNISIAIGVILLITLVFSFFIYKSLKQNKEKNIEISKQKHLVEEKQKEIIDSINYSKRIQNSFLPSDSDLNETFPNSFVLYKPKDIVSGDFYWMMDSKNFTTIQKNFRGIAVADCTGHGVPGAILSMLGSSILNQAILDKDVMSTSDLLDFLNSELKKNLRSKSNEIIRDGMDISCCIIFNDTLKMQFSGANNPCWILRNNTIIELKADKQSVTAAIEENSQPFTLTEFQLQKNDQVFLFTDGYADQFGGPKGKKFKYKQLEKTLIESSSFNANDQKNYILNKFMEWKGDLEQVDDVCIVGLKI